MDHSTAGGRTGQTDNGSCTSEVLSRVKISAVYRALTGVDVHRVGRDTWRAPAAWRGGDGLNVSGDDSRGVWHDFATNEGGGVLDLVVQVRGGSRTDALRWCADLVGAPLSDTPLSPEDRERWATERRAVERDLPAARYWRRAAVQMSESLLDSLKAGLVDPMLPQPDIGELQHLTGLLSRLQRLDGAALVAEYRWWLEHHPGLTAGMVASAKRLERAQRRALLAYLHETDSERAAA